MGVLTEEVRNWNSPIIGAYLLYEFTRGYVENQRFGEAPIGLMHFIGLPILMDPILSDTISKRRKNLQSYSRGFEDKKRTDLLYGIQNKIEESKQQTLLSIDIAVSRGLLAWDSSSGSLVPRTPMLAKRRVGLKPQIKSLGNKANILGTWFSEHDLAVVCNYLRVSI